MITKNLIREILEQYKKHGWNIRRVLLLPETKNALFNSLETLFGEAEIAFSEVNAVWFSRVSNNGREAWEIRHLSDVPFALIETFEKETDENELLENLSEMETRLIERTSKKRI